MEATSDWKLAPVGWLFTTSLPDRLGQEVWAYHAPQTVTSINHIVISSPQLAEEVLKINKAAFSELPASAYLCS